MTEVQIKELIAAGYTYIVADRNDTVFRPVRWSAEYFADEHVWEDFSECDIHFLEDMKDFPEIYEFFQVLIPKF